MAMPDAGGSEEDRTSGDRSYFRTLRIFLAARFAVATAWQIQAVAVGWYVYALTDSALDLGLIGLVQFAPMVGLALPAGHIVDRYARRSIAIIAYTIEGLSSVALAAMALWGAGSADAVFAVIFACGIGRAFEQPSMQSWLPTLVPGHAFPRIAASNSLTAQSAVIVGPALGGLLYLVAPFVPFAVAAAFQLGGIAAILCLPSRPGSGGQPLSWNSLLGGVRFIWQSEAVLGMIALDFWCVLFGGAVALMPIFARDILGTGPAGLGMLRSAPALGAFVMGLALTRRPPVRRVGRRLLITVAVYGAATLAFGLSRSFALSCAALVVVGASDMLSVVIRSTMVQVVAPNAIRGRVTAITSLFTGASNQLGQFESGVTAAWLGPVASVVLGGAATLLIVVLWVRRFPAVGRMDRLVMPEASVDRPRAAVPGSPTSC